MNLSGKLKVMTHIINHTRFIQHKHVIGGFSKCFYSSIENNEETYVKKSNKLNKQQPKQYPSSRQPTPLTHPHLLKPTEITAGITINEYKERRNSIMDLLSKAWPNFKHHILIVVGSPKRYMIDKIPYRFRQNTDLLYLTGCLEPECVLVMHSDAASANHHKSLMFTRPYDPSETLWEGPVTTPSGAPHVWAVDQGLPLSELSNYLSSVEKELNQPMIWYHVDGPSTVDLDRVINDWLLKGKQRRLRHSPNALIHRLRSIKSRQEMTLMRETCRISGEAIEATMKSCRAPVLEHDLFATVDYQCRIKGAEYLAYPPVVAGGSRCNTIHYINNDNIVQPGELVLMDAGCEYRGYSGDITRTWPVNGKFTGAQLDLYEAVLEVQNFVIASCSELPSLNKLFSIMCTKLGYVLQDLCIIPKDLPDSQISRAAFGFCPHHVSHYLGMDVHDCPLVSRNEPLSVGSVFTIEPGVYINERNPAVDPRYLGIGIRIEDDILINEKGKVEILSGLCPKNPEELEKIIGSDFKNQSS